MEHKEKLLLLQNKAWVQEKLELDQDYFKQLSKVQTPAFFWIGCSDSRVPANEITGTEPGEIFVHRNIANMVVHTDLNMLSVLQYAVNVLEVEHVIVCGHYGCGGVRAAMSHQSFGLINKWLRNIKDIYRIHRDQIDALDTEEEKENLMTELNIKEQVLNLAKTSIIQRAWYKDKRPKIHGWVYGIQDGILKDICGMDPDHQTLDDIYQFDFSQDHGQTDL